MIASKSNLYLIYDTTGLEHKAPLCNFLPSRWFDVIVLTSGAVSPCAMGIDRKSMSSALWSWWYFGYLSLVAVNCKLSVTINSRWSFHLFCISPIWPRHYSVNKTIFSVAFFSVPYKITSQLIKITDSSLLVMWQITDDEHRLCTNKIILLYESTVSV